MTRANKGSEQPLQELGSHCQKASKPCPPTPSKRHCQALGEAERMWERPVRGAGGQKEATGPRGTDRTESKERQCPLASRAHCEGTGA